ncbi:hypothetical protein ATCC90586_004166 [Pythium insidiosum]|nr:hypothetical protein ATCC90586_004166 [Pythium insidiosum]
MAAAQCRTCPRRRQDGVALHDLDCGDTRCTECLATLARLCLRQPELLIPMKCCHYTVPLPTVQAVLEPEEAAYYQYLVKKHAVVDLEESKSAVPETIDVTDSSSPVTRSRSRASGAAAAKPAVGAKRKLSLIDLASEDGEDDGSTTPQDERCRACDGVVHLKTTRFRAACGHIFCRDCLKSRCKQSLQNQRDGGIGVLMSCCKKVLPLDVVRPALTNRVYVEYAALFDRSKNDTQRILNTEKRLASRRIEAAKRQRTDGSAAATNGGADQAEERDNSSDAPENCVSCFNTCQSERLVGPCGHTYCRLCITTMASKSLEDRALVPIRCCGKELPLEYVEKVLSKPKIATYRRFLAEKDWRTSNLKSDKEYAALVKKVRGKQCPACGIGVQRVSGCATMTCSNQHRFCWNCVQVNCTAPMKDCKPASKDLDLVHSMTLLHLAPKELETLEQTQVDEALAISLYDSEAAQLFQLTAVNASDHALPPATEPGPVCSCCVSEIENKADRRVLPCGHLYCVSCIRTRCKMGLHDRSMTPAHCCKKEMPIDYVKEVLARDEVEIYSRFVQEQNWRASTLRSDEEYAKTVVLVGGKQCPTCGIGVQRVGGCNALTAVQLTNIFASDELDDDAFERSKDAILALQAQRDEELIAEQMQLDEALAISLYESEFATLSLVDDLEAKAYATVEKKPAPVCSCCASEVDNKADRRVLPCGHLYCVSCIRTRCKMGLHDRSMTPAHCCKKEFPIEYVNEVLAPAEVATYNRFVREQDWRSLGLVSDSEYGDAVKRHGWRQCPGCGIGVERVAGCVRMLCLNRHEFCYGSMVAIREPPFAVLLLRPEIATGFYRFPRAIHADAPGASPPKDADEAPPAAPLPSLIPGVPADHASSFFPDGRVVDELLETLRRHGVEILQRRVLALTRRHVRRLFCAELAGDPAGENAFLDGWTSGPTLALLVATAGAEADDAVSTLRTIVGAEDPHAARVELLQTGVSVEQWPLRARCGLSRELPALYCSPSAACAFRERALLFARAPGLTGPLETALVVLLPSFLRAFPEGRGLLLAEFNRHGVIVTSSAERSTEPTDDELSVLTSELHPQRTTDAQRAAQREHLLAHWRPPLANAPPLCVQLRVVGLDVADRLRTIVGPPSLDEARAHFPDSLRAQLPTQFAAPDDVCTAENARSCLESGVFVSLDAAVADRMLPEPSTLDRTFAIIKPNAARDADVVAEIQLAIRAHGFLIEQQRRLRLSRGVAAAFYAEHTGKPFFERLLAFMTSGDIVAMQLARPRAVPLWRALMGPTNSAVARATHPWTLRARFGVDGTQNATHGSDAPASARRELRFFFGPSALTCAPTESVRELASQPLPLPFHAPETVSRVLTKGVAEMIGRRSEFESPLAACRWLGHWLLEQHEASLAERQTSPSSLGDATRTGPKAKPKLKAQQQSAKQEALLHPNEFKLVAVAVDSDAFSPGSSRKAELSRLLQEHAENWGFAFIDAEPLDPKAPSAAAQQLVRQILDCGRRRVLVFDAPLAATALCTEWRQRLESSSGRALSAVVEIGAAGQSPCSCRELALKAFGGMVPFLTYRVADGPTPHAMRRFFRAFVSPTLVLVDDTEAPIAVERWRTVAQRFGFELLTFGDVVDSERCRENDASGPMTQWRRTGGRLPEDLVVQALKRYLVDPASLRTARPPPPTAQRFLLHGFPWREMDMAGLEARLTSVSAVVRVGRSVEKAELWALPFLSRGQVHLVDPSTSSLEADVAPVLGPIVSVVLGDGDTGRIQRVCDDLSLVWTSLSGAPGRFQELVQRVLVTSRFGRLPVVLHGFPLSRDDALALKHALGDPQVALWTDKNLKTEAADVFPSTLQTLIPPDDRRLAGLLLAKAVTWALGDTAALDVPKLHQLTATLGVGILDLRSLAPATPVEALLDHVHRAFATRCLVLAPRADNPVAQIEALSLCLGHALQSVIVLKQRQRVPPPRPRLPDDDTYDSDEEAEREQARRREAAALAPALQRLVDHVSAKPEIRISVFSFLEPHEAPPFIWSCLRPTILPIFGHAHTFYRSAARRHCLAHHVPFVDVDQLPPQHQPEFPGERGSRAPPSQPLTRAVARSPAPVLIADGCVRVRSSDDPAIAEQIGAMERSLAQVPALVVCRAAMEVLMERRPEGVSRLALADAQDALEESTRELVDFFASHGRRVLSVSCERELQDAEDELSQILRPYYKY